MHHPYCPYLHVNLYYLFPVGKNLALRTCTNINQSQYFFKDADKRYGNDKFEGFLVEVIEKISNYVGFTFELYEVPDGRYGTQQPRLLFILYMQYHCSILFSGNWNGLIGEVMAHNASLSLAPLTINADRERVIDFTKPFLTRGITMLMSAPKAQTSFFQVHLSALSFFLCTIFIFSILMCTVCSILNIN